VTIQLLQEVSEEILKPLALVATNGMLQFFKTTNDMIMADQANKQ